MTEQIKYLEKGISSSGMASKMYLEEIMMQILEEIRSLNSSINLFLPDLTTQNGVIHFLEITKTTFNTYIKNNIFEEGVHYYNEKNCKVFFADEIIKFKQSGQVGRKRKDTNKDNLEGVKQRLGIFNGSRSAEEGIL